MIKNNITEFNSVNFTVYSDIYTTPSGDAVDFSIQGGTDFEGNGVLSGTVSVQTVNTENCTVLLYSERTGEFLAQTLTNALGQFEFKNLNTEELFYLTFKEPTSLWEHRISSRRSPVIPL